MSFFSNTQPPLEGVGKWLATSNVNVPGFLFNSNTSCHDLIGDSCLNPASIFQNPLASFSLEPNMGSINETDSFFSFNPCLSQSTLQSFSPDSSVRNLSSCYSIAPLDGSHNISLDQTSQVHSFSHLALSCQSEMIPQTPLDLAQWMPVSCLPRPTSQYPSNQAVVHDTNNVDVSRKHISGVLNHQPWSDNNHWSSLVTNETIDLSQAEDYSIGSNTMNDNETNIDALWHRFYQASIPALPTNHFSEPNKKDADALQTSISQPHAGGANFLEAESLLKRKIPEGDEGEEQYKKSNSHQCRQCNMSFSTGNALGGHMSYHAKKLKVKQMSKKPHD